jgi:hypothetical protein
MDRSSSISVITYLVSGGHARVKAIEGPSGQRLFILDRDVPDELVQGFHSSEAARILDTFRSLKRAVHTD